MTPDPAHHEPVCPPPRPAVVRAGAVTVERIGRVARRVKADTGQVPLDGRRRIMQLLEELGDLRSTFPSSSTPPPPLHPADLRWMRRLGDQAAMAAVTRAHDVMDTIEGILNTHR